MSSSVVQQCPSCSRVVYFRHTGTTVLPCTCGTVIHRKEGGILLSKPYYLVQNPSDLIQPGTAGVWQGEAFTVLGRCRLWLEEAVFNYWTIELLNGELAYLAEGYGIYAILKKRGIDQVLTAGYLVDVKTGTQKDLLKGQSFLLEKKSVCHKWELEGEVWLPETNAGFTLFDFAGTNGRYLALIQFLPNYILPFDVFYTSYQELQLSGTRVEEGLPKTFTCTNCSAPISVKTYPYAQSCACPSCGMQYTLGDEGFKKTGKYNSLDVGPDITLGSRGKVKGTDYEVIGYTLKEERNQYQSRWKEYTLYNREEGYAFLSEYAGHWIYLKEKGKAPVLPNSNVRSMVFEEEDFQLYNAYHYSIINARGEFPNNIFNSSDTYVKEFISPPEIWIQETNKREGIVWFHGQHLSGSELKSEFDFPAGLPYKEGVGAVEPKFFISPMKLIPMAGIGVLFLIMLHLIVTFSKQNRVVLNETFYFPTSVGAADTAQTILHVTSPFYLEKWRSNLAFDIEAPVDNDWFELGVTLVNKKTGTEYSLAQGVEYYHGYTDGESWREGSQREEAYLTQIPEGEYILQLQGTRSPGYNHLQSFRVQVTYDTMLERNFWFSVLALLIWPIVQYIRTNNNEKKRWYNSPYSPFTYND